MNVIQLLKPIDGLSALDINGRQICAFTNSSNAALDIAIACRDFLSNGLSQAVTLNGVVCDTTLLFSKNGFFVLRHDMKSSLTVQYSNIVPDDCAIQLLETLKDNIDDWIKFPEWIRDEEGNFDEEALAQNKTAMNYFVNI